MVAFRKAKSLKDTLVRALRLLKAIKGYNKPLRLDVLEGVENV